MAGTAEGCVRACVRACVSACVRACVRSCVCVCVCDHRCAPYAQEEAGDAEGTHGANDGDGHVEGAQGHQGEEDHHKVEPAAEGGPVNCDAPLAGGQGRLAPLRSTLSGVPPPSHASTGTRAPAGRALARGI